MSTIDERLEGHVAQILTASTLDELAAAELCYDAAPFNHNLAVGRICHSAILLLAERRAFQLSEPIVGLTPPDGFRGPQHKTPEEWGALLHGKSTEEIVAIFRGGV